MLLRATFVAPARPGRTGAVTNLPRAATFVTARARMMRPEDIADCVFLAIDLPARAIVEEIVVRPA